MDERRRVFSWRARLWLSGLCLALGGCTEELGPVPMPVASARGFVREGSKPVTGGWIEFIPVDGTVGNLRSAKLREDGSFEADRVAVGRNLIRFVNVRIGDTGLARLFGAFHSPIRRDIPSKPGETLTIDLIEEGIQFRKSRSRDPRPAQGAEGAR